MHNVMYMARKVRKQVYIEPGQEQRLKRVAKRTGVPEAEIIRQALEVELRAPARSFPIADRLEAWQAERAFIRRLIEKGSVPGGRTWRREDLYDRSQRPAN